MTPAPPAKAPKPPQNRQSDQSRPSHDQTDLIRRCQKRHQHRNHRARCKGHGGHHGGLNRMGHGRLGYAKLVMRMCGHGVLARQSDRNLPRQTVVKPAPDIDARQFIKPGLGHVAQLFGFARQIGLPGIGLRTDGNVFAGGHRHRPRDKTGTCCDQDLGTPGPCGRNPDPQTCGRDEAVICPQHGSTQPADPVNHVNFRLGQAAHGVGWRVNVLWHRFGCRGATRSEKSSLRKTGVPGFGNHLKTQTCDPVWRRFRGPLSLSEIVEIWLTKKHKRMF